MGDCNPVPHPRWAHGLLGRGTINAYRRCNTGEALNAHLQILMHNVLAKCTSLQTECHGEWIKRRVRALTIRGTNITKASPQAPKLCSSRPVCVYVCRMSTAATNYSQDKSAGAMISGIKEGIALDSLRKTLDLRFQIRRKALDVTQYHITVPVPTRNASGLQWSWFWTGGRSVSGQLASKLQLRIMKCQ